MEKIWLRKYIFNLFYLLNFEASEKNKINKINIYFFYNKINIYFYYLFSPELQILINKIYKRNIYFLSQIFSTQTFKIK